MKLMNVLETMKINCHCCWGRLRDKSYQCQWWSKLKVVPLFKLKDTQEPEDEEIQSKTSLEKASAE